jgi:hypothetical protein
MRTVLRSQTIIAARNEINKSLIAQILKLLSYLGPDALATGIAVTQMPFERVGLVKREVAFAEGLSGDTLRCWPQSNFDAGNRRRLQFLNGCHIV